MELSKCLLALLDAKKADDAMTNASNHYRRAINEVVAVEIGVDLTNIDINWGSNATYADDLIDAIKRSEE